MVVGSILRNMASFSFSPSAARSYIPRVTAIIRPLQVPQQEMETKAKISIPPTWPKTFINALLAPDWAFAMRVALSMAPERPM